MASDPERQRKVVLRSDPKLAARFLEELSWLLKSYEGMDPRLLTEIADDFQFASRSARHLRGPVRPKTVQLLVGVLPGLFTDEALFRSNEDIVEFSRHALGITIPRWHKKSKYELIGHVVCHTDQAPSARVERLVAVLGDMLENPDSARGRIEKERNSGATWNEVVRGLLGSPE